MIACEDTSQQQLHYLQSCGFRGLWRFAGPYTNVSSEIKYTNIPSNLSYSTDVTVGFKKPVPNIPNTIIPKYGVIRLQSNCTPESAELFVNCLEAMVETCLPVEECDSPNNNEPAAGRGKRTISYQSEAASKTKPSIVGFVRRYSRTSSEETGASSVRVE